MASQLDESVVGLTTAPEDFEVEKGAIRRFAETIGDDNLLYLDEVHAQRCGYASVLAPPTFPTTFRMTLPVAIDPSHILHGEQEYSYTRPIVAGDILRCATTIRSVREREGSIGKITILVAEIVGEDHDGQPVFTGKSTIIVH